MAGIELVIKQRSSFNPRQDHILWLEIVGWNFFGPVIITPAHSTNNDGLDSLITGQTFNPVYKVCHNFAPRGVFSALLHDFERPRLDFAERYLCPFNRNAYIGNAPPPPRANQRVA